MPRHFLRGTDLQLRDAKTGAHGVIGAALDLVEPTRIRYPLHVESFMACADHSTLFISRSRRAAEPGKSVAGAAPRWLKVPFGKFAKLVGNRTGKSQRDGPISDRLPPEAIADHINGAVGHPTGHTSLGAWPAGPSNRSSDRPGVFASCPMVSTPISVSR